MHDSKAALRKDMGKRLREIREAIGMSREDVSAEFDISAKFLGLIERGERNIDAERLKNICEYFQCSADYVLSGTKPDTPIGGSDIAKIVDLILDDNAKEKLSEFIKAFFAQYRD